MTLVWRILWHMHNIAHFLQHLLVTSPVENCLHLNLQIQSRKKEITGLSSKSLDMAAMLKKKQLLTLSFSDVAGAALGQAQEVKEELGARRRATGTGRRTATDPGGGKRALLPTNLNVAHLLLRGTQVLPNHKSTPQLQVSSPQPPRQQGWQQVAGRAQ